MEDIKKIIKIDMLAIRPYLTLKNLIIMIVMGVFYPLINRNVYTVFGVTMVFGILFCSYPFLVGDESGIDALYGAFGIQRRNVVYGRYIWSNFILLICLILGLFFSVLVSVLIDETTRIRELAYVIPIIFILGNLIIAAQYPFYFKYGYAKSKVIISSVFFIMAILALVIYYFEGYLIRLFDVLISNMYLLIFTILVVYGILYLISMAASIRIYRNREFG